MLVLSREIGQSVTIGDVTLTLARAGERYFEVSVENSERARRIFTLPQDQSVDIGGGVRVVFVSQNAGKVRLGIEAPR